MDLGLHFRRATFADVPALSGLWASAEASLHASLSSTIESSCVPLSVLDERGKPYILLIAADQPAASVWQSLRQAAGEATAPQFLRSDTLWIVAAACTAEARTDAEAWSAAFAAVLGDLPEIGRLAATDAELTCLPEELGRYWHRAAEAVTGDSLELYASDKDAWIAPLHVRAAAVEDVDDLVPIFNEGTELRSEEVGDFFLADVINTSADDPNRAVVVMADKASGKPVGFAALARMGSHAASLLRDQFMLEPFNGLMKRSMQQAREEAAEIRDAVRANRDWLHVALAHKAELASAVNWGDHSAPAASAASLCESLNRLGAVWGFDGGHGAASMDGAGLGDAMLAEAAACGALPSGALREDGAYGSSAIPRSTWNLAAAATVAARERRCRCHVLAHAVALLSAEPDGSADSASHVQSMANGAGRLLESALQTFDDMVEQTSAVVHTAGNKHAASRPSSGATTPTGVSEASDGELEEDEDDLPPAVPCQALASALSARLAGMEELSFLGIDLNENDQDGLGYSLLLEAALQLGSAAWPDLHGESSASSATLRQCSSVQDLPLQTGAASNIFGGTADPAVCTSLPPAIGKAALVDRDALEAGLTRVAAALGVGAVPITDVLKSVAQDGIEHPHSRQPSRPSTATSARSGTQTVPDTRTSHIVGGVSSARATRVVIMPRRAGSADDAAACVAAGRLAAAVAGVPLIHVRAYLRRVHAQLEAEAVCALEKAGAAEAGRRAAEEAKRKAGRTVRAMAGKPYGPDTSDEEVEDEVEPLGEGMPAALRNYTQEFAPLAALLASPLAARGYVLVDMPASEDAAAQLGAALRATTGAVASLLGVDDAGEDSGRGASDAIAQPAAAALAAQATHPGGTAAPQVVLFAGVSSRPVPDADTTRTALGAAHWALLPPLPASAAAVLAGSSEPVPAPGVSLEVEQDDGPTEVPAGIELLGDLRGEAMLHAALVGHSGIEMPLASFADGLHGATPMPTPRPPAVEVDVLVSVPKLGEAAVKMAPAAAELVGDTVRTRDAALEHAAQVKAEVKELRARARDGDAAAKRQLASVKRPTVPHALPDTPFDIRAPGTASLVRSRVAVAAAVLDEMQVRPGTLAPELQAVCEDVAACRESVLAAMLVAGSVSLRRVAGGDARRLNFSASLGPDMAAVAQRVQTALAHGEEPEPGSVANGNVEAAFFEDELTDQPGVPDAAAITLFGVAQNATSRAHDLLPAVFALFPDVTYLVLTQPHAAPEGPLHPWMVQVRHCPQVSPAHVLYVAHRAALQAPHCIKVRNATHADRSALSRFASQAEVSSADVIMRAAVAEPGHPDDLQAVVMECAGQVVGAAVTARQGASSADVQALAAAYGLHTLVDGQALAGKWRSLLACELNAMFTSPLTQRALLRRVLLTAQCSALLYRHWGGAAVGAGIAKSQGPEDPESPTAFSPSAAAGGDTVSVGAVVPAESLPDVLDQFALVPPRALPEAPGDAVATLCSVGWRPAAQEAAALAEVGAAMASVSAPGFEYAVSMPACERPALSDPHMALAACYIASARTLCTPRVVVNARVVVVGASTAGVSALQTLLCQPNLQLTHVSMVAPEGLALPPSPPATAPPACSASKAVEFEQPEEGALAAPWQPWDGAFPAHMRARLALGLRARVLPSSMVELDRRSKIVSLPDATSVGLAYDLLLLAPGLAEPSIGRLGLPSLAALPPGVYPVASRYLPYLEEDIVDLVDAVPDAHAQSARSRAPPSRPGSVLDVDSPAAALRSAGIEHGRDVMLVGDGLEALTGIAAAIDRGVHPSRIVWVRGVQPLVALRAGAGELPRSAMEVLSELRRLQGASEPNLDTQRTYIQTDLATEQERDSARVALHQAAQQLESQVLGTLDALGVLCVVGWRLSYISGAGPSRAAARHGYPSSGPVDQDGQAIGKDVAAWQSGDGLAAAALPASTAAARRSHRPSVALSDEQFVPESATSSISTVAGRSNWFVDSLGIAVELEAMPLLSELQDAEDQTDADHKTDAPGADAVLHSVNVRLLLLADLPDVDAQFFAAVNEAGLVYDGRLVVDHTMRTNDPAVFATGTVIKWSRRYRAELSLQAYGSAEVGSATARAMLRVLDPRTAADSEQFVSALSGVGVESGVDPPRGSSVLPRFSSAKICNAMLPGGLRLLHCRLPEYQLGATGRALPAPPGHNVAMDSELLARDSRALCELVLDAVDRVAELLYLGGLTPDVHNLCGLVGLAQAALRGAGREWERGQVAHWLEYFRAPWTTALFHDRTLALLGDLADSIAVQPEVADLIDAADELTASDLLSNIDKQLSEALAAGVGVAGAALDDHTRELVERAVLSHLRTQADVLSMYYLPTTADLSNSRGGNHK